MAEITVTPLEDAVVCIKVRGEYDLADRPQGRMAVRRALESDASGILIDLSQCRFIDSAAIRCVSTFQEEAERTGKAFAVVDSHLQLGRFMRILELDDNVGIAATREAALQELGGASPEVAVAEATR